MCKYIHVCLHVYWYFDSQRKLVSELFGVVRHLIDRQKKLASALTKKLNMC